jgi:hypothetical protein
MAENLKQLQVSRGATIVDEEQSTINGRDAYFLSWSGQDPLGRTYKNAAIITQTSDFLYAFSIGSNPIENFENMAAILNGMVLGAEFSETGSNSQRPSNNLGGGGGTTANNDTFQEGQGLQDGRGSGSGLNGDQFDPFGQGEDSLSSGDRGDGSGSESPDGLRPQNFGDDNAVSSAGFESYTDPRYGFSIQYPAGWDPFVTPPPGSQRDVIGVLSGSNDPILVNVGLDNSTDAKNLAHRNIVICTSIARK